MRIVFLLPNVKLSSLEQGLSTLAWKWPADLGGRWAMRRRFGVDQVYGGQMNILRHAMIAQQCHAEVVIATTTGIDSYGDVFGLNRRFSFIPWRDRRPVDLCIVPDLASRLIDDVVGPVVAYEQNPLLMCRDFDFSRPNVHIWTDSGIMEQQCRETYPGKPIRIVPNIVDSTLYPFVPQSQREQGLLFAFPRKGPDFIAQTQRAYRKLGGAFWRFELVDGLPLQEFAAQFRRPQAFLASAIYEGCALPPQEAMAAGVVVVGRTARGANFVMQDGVTSLNGETPEEAARCLVRLESEPLRQSLADSAYKSISRFFPDQEPLSFWKSELASLLNDPV
jgi:hypothetical protein